MRKALLLFALAALPAASAQTPDDSTLVVAQSSDSSSLDPASLSSIASANIARHLWGTLLEITPEGEIVPYLAESFTVSESGTEISFTLHGGLTCHDGEALTAEDVVFSGQYCMDPEGGCSQLAKFEGVESIEAVDDLTVRITFTNPMPDPYSAFVGSNSPVIQKAQFEACLGANAPTCVAEDHTPACSSAMRASLDARRWLCWSTPTSPSTVCTGPAPIRSATTRAGSGWLQAPFGTPIHATRWRRARLPASRAAASATSTIASSSSGAGPSAGRWERCATPTSTGVLGSITMP